MSETEVPLPKFEAHEKLCGNCKLWSAHSVDHRGWVGPCRMQSQRGLFPPSAPVCDKFAPRGVAASALSSSSNSIVPSGGTRSRVIRNIAPTVVRNGERVGPSGPAHTPSPLLPATERPMSPLSARPVRDPNEQIDLEGLCMTREELMDLFRDAAGDAHAAPMAGKWEGGVIQLIPGNRDLAPKELPIDHLFNKVVMIRDRLRTLEQKLNAHPKLSNAEKVELQHYVTRCYGSLTTFNVLFRDKGDQFVGQKGEE